MTRSRDTANIIPTVDAKGDLLVGTADNTIDNLSPGTNGQVLTANSATGTGLEWKTVSATEPVTYSSTTQTVGLTDAFIGQTVRTYASASARNTAIPSPTEGMVTYLNDTDQIEVWSGSAWVRRVSTSLPFAMAAGTASLPAAVTAVTLPASRFTQSPIISLTPIFGGSAENSYYSCILSSGTSSFSAYNIRHDGIGPIAGSLHWQAFQMTSAAAAG
jgi:hypothetical protein